jgi:hypothetical protein
MVRLATGLSVAASGSELLAVFAALGVPVTSGRRGFFTGGTVRPCRALAVVRLGIPAIFEVLSHRPLYVPDPAGVVCPLVRLAHAFVDFFVLTGRQVAFKGQTALRPLFLAMAVHNDRFAVAADCDVHLGAPLEALLATSASQRAVGMHPPVVFLVWVTWFPNLHHQKRIGASPILLLSLLLLAPAAAQASALTPPPGSSSVQHRIIVLLFTRMNTSQSVVVAHNFVSF